MFYVINNIQNMKFELMLMRRVKAYSSSCLQTVLVFLQPFRCNSLLKCAPQLKIAKVNKTPILGVQGLSKSSMLIRLKSSSLMPVVTGSMPMPICNHFHETLANSGKITTSTGGYHILMPSCAGFLESTKIKTCTIKIYVQC